MSAIQLPGSAASIAAAIAAASNGDTIMLAPKPSFVIMKVTSATTFKVLAGQGDRLRPNDLLYVFDPRNEATTWSLVLISTISGDTITASSVTGSPLAAEQIAIPTYNENARVSINKTLRLIGQPYCAQNLTTSLHARLRGDPGPDPRVVVYGHLGADADGVSLSGLTVIDHGDSDEIVGSPVSTREWQCTDCTIRPCPGGGNQIGISYATLVRRCRVLGAGVAGGTYGQALRLSEATVESTIVANWFTYTSSLVQATAALVMKNCTIAGNFTSYATAASRSWCESASLDTTVSNCIFLDNTLSGTTGNHYVMRNTSGTANNYGCVYWNSQSGVVTTGLTDNGLSNVDPQLTATYEVQDASPSVVRSTAYPTHMAVTDLSRFVLDTNQHCVGALATSPYKSAAFAWTVTRVHDGTYMSVVFASAGVKAWVAPVESAIEWTFQSPQELLRWIEVGQLLMVAANSTTPAAATAFDLQIGMNADGKIRAVATGTDITGFAMATTGHTASRWIIGRGVDGTPITDSGTEPYMFNYLPNYFASKIALDEGDLGEYQPSVVETFDLGGVGVLASAVRSYRSMLYIRFVSEADSAQRELAPWLFQTRRQRFVDFFRKLTSGTPVRLYLTNHRVTMGALRDGYRVADMNMLDGNKDVVLAWAESVMGRYDVSVDLCELWGF